MDYLKDCYKFFRPLLQELLASNIDFSKAEPEKAEMEIIKKWVNVNLWGEDTAMDYAKDFFYKRIDEDWEQEIERSGSSEEDSSDQAVYISPVIPAQNNIGSCLEKYKNSKTENGVVWVFMASGATLEGHAIDPGGEKNRYARDRFDKLLEELRFSDNVRNIYKENEQYRFNALKNPVIFLEQFQRWENAFSIMRGSRIDKLCGEQSWKVNYEKLLDLLRVWFKSQKDNKIDKKIDYMLYRETLDVLTALIPTVSAANIVKRVEEYEMDRENIEKELYDYYKKETIGRAGGYLQKYMEGNRLVENIENVMDRIHQGDFTEMQKDFLMDRFLDNIDSFYDDCKWILEVILEFQNRCAVWNITDADYEYYQHLWGHIVRKMERYY